jgi:hypothetical protein
MVINNSKKISNTNLFHVEVKKVYSQLINNSLLIKLLTIF